MSKPKHTPGPWTIRSNIDEFTVYKINKRGRNANVALVTTEANARLIAAAPGMLEALELLAQYRVAPCRPEDAAIELERAVRAMRALAKTAIAKATGGDE